MRGITWRRDEEEDMAAPKDLGIFRWPGLSGRACLAGTAWMMLEGGRMAEGGTRRWTSREILQRTMPRRSTAWEERFVSLGLPLSPKTSETTGGTTINNHGLTPNLLPRLCTDGPAMWTCVMARHVLRAGATTGPRFSMVQIASSSAVLQRPFGPCLAGSPVRTNLAHRPRWRGEGG